VAAGRGVAIVVIGGAVTAMTEGCGCGVAGGAVGALVGCGCGVRGACVGATLGLGEGAAVGGTFIVTATVLAGAAVGTCSGSGAGETAITACVGIGFGAAELSGAGVGFGGAVGANFASSCTTRGCGGAERGCAATTRGDGTTCACGTGNAAFTAGAGALDGTGRELMVMMTPPGNDSGDCCDDDVATENKKSAMRACTSIEARKLTAVRSGRCLSSGSRFNKRRSLRGFSRTSLEPMEKIQKRTKIVATLGPASRDPEIIRALIHSGANVFRLNFSHGSPQEHGATTDAIRKIANELGEHIAVLQDLPGPKVRTGPLADGQASVVLERGKPFTLTTEETPGTAERVSVSYRDLPADVAVGTRLYLQDGAITLRILDKTATEIATTVEVGGDLRPQQGINYPDGTLKISAVSDRDLEFLAFGLEKDVDYVAVSFVRSADDIHRVKQFIRDRGKNPHVLAKIEKHEALDDIDKIVAAADGIMVARGDLGIEVPLEQVPLIQKDLIARCNRASKPVVTATQMLESMTFNSRPTRAETTDVANAILDGTDAVMLSGETARGQYPIEAVRVMAEIAREVEKHYPHEVLQLRRLEGATRNIATSIAEAATRSSAELNLKYIVTGTTTGNAAHHISAFRPKAQIIALTPLPEVARRLALLWGIESILIERYSSIDVLLHIMEQRMLAEGLVERGDCVAFTTGMPVGGGGTNLLKIHEIA
jgi:pyruvate kinase